MRVGSLFAGVGGFDLAAERAGMEVAWQSETDKHASKVLEARWPGLNLGDIHEIENPPTVDVLCGGFPCQSYSIAGRRGGLAEDRGALWWEYLRLIKDIKPEWVVAENVPGLLSSSGGKDFTTIVQSLIQCGYGVAWRILDAQYFDLAQSRKRLFIVAHSGGQPRPEILALSEGMCGYPEPIRETRSRHSETIAGVPFSSSGNAVVGTLTTAFGSKNYSNVQEVKSGSLVCYQMQAEIIGRGPTAGPNGLGIRTFDQPAYTLSVVGGAEAIATTKHVRRLTPAECEKLQGFWAGWTAVDGNPEEQRYKQMGNAVTVPVASWVMQNIADASE